MIGLRVVFCVSLLVLMKPAETWARDRQPFVRSGSLAVVEASRALPARAWTSRHCLTWTDGAEQCSRRSTRSKPICKPVAAGAEQTVRNPIACRNSDLKSLARYCSRFGVAEPGTRGRGGPRGVIHHTEWVRARSGRWLDRGWDDNAIGNVQNSVAAALMQAGGPGPYPEARTTACLAVHR